MSNPCGSPLTCVAYVWGSFSLRGYPEPNLIKQRKLLPPPFFKIFGVQCSTRFTLCETKNLMNITLDYRELYVQASFHLHDQLLETKNWKLKKYKKVFQKPTPKRKRLGRPRFFFRVVKHPIPPPFGVYGK